MEIKGKNILVTGASGLVGVPTVLKCIEQGANKVYAVDIKISDALNQLSNRFSDQCKIITSDLTELSNCQKLFLDNNINIVLHIAGIKGSPARTKSKPADYLIPMLLFNTNMMKASFDNSVDWFVYLSSVGVYAPADVMEEDSVWQTFPSKNDWHPGWAKRMGELTLDALKVQYGWDNWTIIRPSNIYGVNDNFAQDATVISSNIWKLYNVESDDMICWGNGSAKRDFVFGDDVAQASLDVIKNEVRDVINFGCGQAVTIKETIETIVDIYKQITNKTKNIVWDESKPNGDLLRCLSSVKQEKYQIVPKTSLYDGLYKTIKSYHERVTN